MDAKLNHSDLSALLAKEAGITVAKAELLTKAMFDLIIEGLENDGIVKINGFGTFRLTDVASRSSVNVNTGEKFEIKGHKKLTFTPADALKDCVNQPFAMFEPVEVDETYRDDDRDSDEPFAEECAAEESVAETPVAQEETISEAANEPVLETVEETVYDVDAEKPSETVDESAQAKVEVPESGKRNCRWLYIALPAILLVLAAVAYIYFPMAADGVKTITVEPSTSALAEEAPQQGVSGYATDAVTGATVDATSGATLQDSLLIADEKSLDSLVAEPEEYKFVITEELASLDLKNITPADTVMYEAVGELAVHKVVASETLTRVALKYYGDKKLWPYIVKYNSLARPDDLRKGMELRIPMLKPRK